MASDLEKTMDEFESALTSLLQISVNGDAGAELRTRLLAARTNADRARATGKSADNEYRAAVDRAYGTARQKFR